ncbi:hypothetical protein [uncultured Clostridium sp.]|jgi:hypothetical protein|uniref:hypothetical protein n=1 Tax=uncultured Clostridium sp. TaxID=59620 RepID=UPI002634E499|nr:hypothetical protein [uncultured Clostridium sp.]
MGFKDKISKYYTDSYLKKYGDRLTQFQGNVLSAKVEEKTILGIFNKITVTLMVRPERSKVVSKCIYKKNRWFKKPTFLSIRQGNNVVVQGLKSVKDNKEYIEISNLLNLTTKQDLIPVDHSQMKKQRQQTPRMR